MFHSILMKCVTICSCFSFTHRDKFWRILLPVLGNDSGQNNSGILGHGQVYSSNNYACIRTASYINFYDNCVACSLNPA